LQFELINNECRQLTSQGFNYSKKFYESRFKVRFSDSSVALSTIEEIHDRRHLFVHRGGKVDTTYQRKYKSDKQIGDKLEISEQYFYDSVNALLSLADYVTTTLDKQFPPRLRKLGTLGRSASQFELTSEITISSELSNIWDKHLKSIIPVKDGEALGYLFKGKFIDVQKTNETLNGQFSFIVGSDVHLLSEIIVGCVNINDSEAEWIVDGPKTIVGAYVGYIKALHRKGLFLELETKRL